MIDWLTDWWSSLSIDLAPINLDRVQSWIDQGRIDPARPITIRELADSRCIHQTREGVKLLAHSVGAAPALRQPVHIVVSRASDAAIAAVEAAGGSVTTRYYTPAAIARIMRREMHPFVSMAWEQASGSRALMAAAGIEGSGAGDAGGEGAGAASGKISELQVMKKMGFKYRLPDPTARRDIEYYRDPAKRGYLSHLLRPTEGPSLFFRSPAEREERSVGEVEVLPENRLWWFGCCAVIGGLGFV
jgi:large subunit ribosomal protein L15